MMRRVFGEEKASGVRDSMDEYMKRLSMFMNEPRKALEETERLEKGLSEQLTRLRNSMLYDDQMSSRSMKHWTNSAAFHVQMLIHAARLRMALNDSSHETDLCQHCGWLVSERLAGATREIPGKLKTTSHAMVLRSTPRRAEPTRRGPAGEDDQRKPSRCRLSQKQSPFKRCLEINQYVAKESAPPDSTLLKHPDMRIEQASSDCRLQGEPTATNENGAHVEALLSSCCRRGNGLEGLGLLSVSLQNTALHSTLAVPGVIAAFLTGQHFALSLDLNTNQDNPTPSSEWPKHRDTHLGRAERPDAADRGKKCT
ncbi:hypothetical protein NFI96_004474 [Prochilodus magdalenae]|nr:hypothetical protein NFI96_004474 [Prochilodus magdalenae]